MRRTGRARLFFVTSLRPRGLLLVAQTEKPTNDYVYASIDLIVLKAESDAKIVYQMAKENPAVSFVISLSCNNIVKALTLSPSCYSSTMLIIEPPPHAAGTLSVYQLSLPVESTFLGYGHNIMKTFSFSILTVW